MIYKQEKREIVVNGYAYPSIDPKVLTKWLPSLTFVTTFSYGITPTGELIDLEDDAILGLAKDTGVLMAVTPLDETGNFSTTLAEQFLENPVAQYRLIDNILATIQQKDMLGVNFDFEYVLEKNRDQYTRFVDRAARRLSEYGYIVTVALAPKVSADQPGVLYEGHDYRGLGQAASYSIIMTYEWGYTYSPPRAVAPLDQVRRVIEYAVTEIKPEKILMGIPNYGYDWTLPFVEGQSRAESISNTEAVARAQRYNAEIQFDPVAQSPYFNYTDGQGVEHEVWFEDERSIAAKLALVDEFKLGGISIWTIMNFFPGAAELINERYIIAKE